jgi:leucyl/phenylalanyl-tRNA--protein transferase
MFSTKTDASKIAYWALTQIGVHAGWQLIDAQFENPHLMSLGARLISRVSYLEHLANVRDQASFDWQDANQVLASANFPVSRHVCQ